MINFQLSSADAWKYTFNMKTWLSDPSVGRVAKFLIGLVFTAGSIVLAQETNAPSSETVAAPIAPPPRQYISPFSGVASSAYSYTSTNIPSASVFRSTLVHDPFSQTLVNSDVATATPTLQLPTWEPLPPPFFDLPPGAFLRRPSAQAGVNVQPPNAAPAAIPVPVPDLSVVPDLTYYNFPPGAALRRVAIEQKSPGPATTENSK